MTESTHRLAPCNNIFIGFLKGVLCGLHGREETIPERGRGGGRERDGEEGGEREREYERDSVCE